MTVEMHAIAQSTLALWWWWWCRRFDVHQDGYPLPCPVYPHLLSNQKKK